MIQEERVTTTLRGLFKAANQEFLDKDKDLILSNVNERTLCGALSQHLRTIIDESEFRNYHVDVEYNRNNGKVKTIMNDQFEEVTINCDLIVHSRGEIIGRDNLIAIEMKKSRSPKREKQVDKIRLSALTKDSFNKDIWSADGKTFPKYVCGYCLGIYYEVNVMRRLVVLEYFVKGNFSFKETIPF